MYSIEEIAAHVNGKIIGDSNLIIKGICGINNGENDCISYIQGNQYYKYFTTTNASAIIIDNEFNYPESNKTLIKVNNAASAFSNIVDLFHKKDEWKPAISKTANIDPSANLGNDLYIGHNVTIDRSVSIEDGVFIGSGSYIGQNCTIGKKSVLSNNVTLVKHVKLGKAVKINTGAVIGGTGFGLFRKNKKHFRISHIGNVIIDNYTCIGANTCIDRGTIDDTKIGKFTHIDNLVQIAHNVEIGEGCIIAGQTGIAGSTILGDFVTTGGQVGIVGHIKIGNSVTIAGKSLVTKSILSNQVVSGIPAQNHKKRIKQEATINRLPKMIKNIKK